ncbi:MAG: hypothetical protein ACR2H4_08505, partial [Pyrinomonadaceae bacterium]
SSSPVSGNIVICSYNTALILTPHRLCFHSQPQSILVVRPKGIYPILAIKLNPQITQIPPIRT